jgi:triosephosphate isomerase
MSIRPKSLVVGNWKMNGSLAANSELLAAVLGDVAGASSDMAVCVPYPYLVQAQSLLRNSSIAWGAQDVSEHAVGAYTGEVSAAMLMEFGCSYVIVGHSERRSFYGDSDTVVAAKYMAAQRAGIIPVLCVGETLAERDAGITGEVVIRQLNAIIDMAGAATLANAVVAYEPVWAIGTGRTATPQQAQEVHAVIRTRVAAVDAGVAPGLRILYGGSVKPGNAGELFGQPDINGGLIGGASLVAADFLAICSAA